MVRFRHPRPHPRSRAAAGAAPRRPCADAAPRPPPAARRPDRTRRAARGADWPRTSRPARRGRGQGESPESPSHRHHPLQYASRARPCAHRPPIGSAPSPGGIERPVALLGAYRRAGYPSFSRRALVPGRRPRRIVSVTEAMCGGRWKAISARRHPGAALPRTTEASGRSLRRGGTRPACSPRTCRACSAGVQQPSRANPARCGSSPRSAKPRQRLRSTSTTAPIASRPLAACGGGGKSLSVFARTELSLYARKRHAVFTHRSNRGPSSALRLRLRSMPASQHHASGSSPRSARGETPSSPASARLSDRPLAPGQPRASASSTCSTAHLHRRRRHAGPALGWPAATASDAARRLRRAGVTARSLLPPATNSGALRTIRARTPSSDGERRRGRSRSAANSTSPNTPASPARAAAVRPFEGEW